MKNRGIRNKKSILSICLLLLMCFNIQAKEFVCGNKLTVGQVTVGALLNVTNPDYAFMLGHSNWANSIQFEQVQNRIILSVDVKDEQFQPASYQADVTLRITRKILVAGVFTDVSEDKTLSVTYNIAGKYKGKAVLTLEGGHIFDVEVLSVTPAVSSKIMNLELEIETLFERYKTLDLTTIATIATDPNYVQSRNELEVEWPVILGAEEYELEWTYVNNVSPNGTTLPANQVLINEQIFRSNNTRVSLKDLSEHGGTKIAYRIPMIYEQGYILYRVRAIGLDINSPSQVIAGKWSSDNVLFTNVSEFKNYADNTNNYFFLAQGHEERLNWQSSVTFIEEGKNKIAVSYADGTLRSRQQVSRLNTEDETVVGESIYDHQGRKAIDIIPAPTNQQKIQYTPNFNNDVNNTNYSRKNFDLDADDECNLKADPVSDLSGAGKYYSPNNILKFTHDVAIPDAQGYPFIQTVYTNDNTGRVRSQGGIGTDHKIGSDHETKNFYGKPLQVEIDRMFGSESGYAAHYQKNLVQDPNGQVTVSYLDLQGNVVATSLGGENLGNLKALTSNSSIQVSEDLLEEVIKDGKKIEKQSISSDGMSKVYSQELLVSTDGAERTFTYDVQPEKLSVLLECSDGSLIQEFCFDCVLNVELLVINKCGKQMLVNGGLSGHVVGQGLLDFIADENNLIDIKDCGRPIDNLSYTDVTSSIKVGDYTVRKVLTINQKVLDHYTENFLASECLTSLDDFYQQNKAEIDTTGCATDCELCLDNVGEYDQYDINAHPDCAPCLSYNEYLSRKEACDDMCEDEPTNCLSKLVLMKMDVAPLGQYGELDGFNVDYDEKSFLLSVYNPDNLLPANVSVTAGNVTFTQLYNGAASWKFPEHYEKGTGYFNSDGQRAKVEVTYLGNSIFEPAVNSSVSTKYLSKGDIIKVDPQLLINVSDFVANWPEDNSWSESLIKYHPEFSGYEYCVTNTKSHKFDRAMLTSKSIGEFIINYNNEFEKTLDPLNSDALALKPIGSSSSNSLDPYFNSLSVNSSSSEYVAMDYILNNFKVVNGETFSMLRFAYVTKICPQSLSNSCGAVCDIPDVNNIPDEVWQVFKSMYLAEKQKMYDIKQNLKSLTDNFYCGCIGNENWSYSDDHFLNSKITSSTPYHIQGGGVFNGGLSQVYNANQPCSWFRFALFKNKEPIFPKFNIVTPASFNTGIECYLTAKQVDDSGFPERTFPDPNCNERDKGTINAMQNNAIESYMETCGECPVTYDFEFLLTSLVKETNQLENSNVAFGCYPVGLEGWTDLINASSGFTGGGVNYSGSVDVPNNILTGSFNDNNSSTPVIVKLKLEDEYLIDDFSTGTKLAINPTFSDVLSFCCVEFNPTPILLIPVGNESSFYVSVTVLFTQTDGATREVKLKIEGVVDGLDFQNCSVTSHSRSQVGQDLSNFFSVLAFYDIDPNTTVQTSGNFASSTSVFFSDNENPTDYLMISDLLKENGPGGSSDVTRWEWKQTNITVDKTQLTASLTAFSGLNGSYVDLGSMSFTFNSSLAIDFYEIVKILAIEPYNGNGNADYEFTVVVELYDGLTGYSHQKLIVTQNINEFKTGNSKTLNRDSGL